MTITLTELTWELRAACRGPDAALFFPPPTGETALRRDRREQLAKLICAACPVQRECLEYALRVREPFGIWGGLNEAERRERSEPPTSGRRKGRSLPA